MLDHKKLIPTISKYDIASNLAMFLQEKTGTIYGRYCDHMLAADQRKLFGMFLGKGTIFIDGRTERITHTVKRCFGMDFETTFDKTWNELDITTEPS